METDFRSDAPEGYFLTTGDHKKKTFQTEYELLESIGVGSFSEVKKCRHRHTGKLQKPLRNHYVIKFLGKLYAVKISKRNSTSEQAGMRDDEIQILVKFGQHPNIITVKVCQRRLSRSIEYGYPSSTFQIFFQDIFIEKSGQDILVYLVTELMMGGEMFEKIQKQKVFSEREASSVMKTITQTGVTHLL